MDIHIHIHHHGSPGGDSSLDGRLANIEDGVSAISTQGEHIMASIELARQALSQLNDVTNTMAAAVQSVVVADAAEDAAFEATIDDLKAQIASGKAVTEAQLEELTEGMGGTKATLEAVAAALSAMGASPTNPIPLVDIPPVEPPTE